MFPALEFWTLHPRSISDSWLCDLDMAHNSSTKLSSPGLICSENEMIRFSFAVNAISSRIQSGHKHAMIVVSSKAHSSAPIIRIVLSMSESSHPHILLNRRSMADILSRISSTRSTCSSATLPPTQNRFRQKNSLGGSSFGNDKSDDDTDVALEVVGISSSFPVFVLAPSSPRIWQSLLQYKEPHHRFMPPFVVQKLQGRGVVLLTCRSINLGRHAEMDSCGGDASTSGDGSWA